MGGGASKPPTAPPPATPKKRTKKKKTAAKPNGPAPVEETPVEDFEAEAGAEEEDKSPLVFFGSEYVCSEAKTLRLQEAHWSMSGQDMSIYDESTREKVFRCDGTVLSLRRKTTLKDQDGKTIGAEEGVMMSLTKKRCIENENGDVLAYIGCESSWNPMNHNSEVTTADGKTLFQVKGNWTAKDFKFMHEGAIVAFATKPTTARSWMLGDDEYLLTCNPGCDMAFMVLVIAALDDLYNDDK